MTPTDFSQWLMAAERPPLVMGILNLTPDSFSDGGQYSSPEQAVGDALAMIAAGADLIDIGGESTRPGSDRVPAQEQLRRILPVVRELAQATPAVLSVDTTLSEVAEAAADAGASLVNDISAGRDDGRMVEVIARRKLPIILMHMQGDPKTMQINPTYGDVVGEVKAFLGERARFFESGGVAPRQILLDPGIGFGKTIEHNLLLLRGLPALLELGRPLLVGSSRKGFIGRITGEADASSRLFGTAATVAWSVANGASIVRVHDVAEMARVVRMTRAITHGFTGSS